ncbi:HAMP domain-containing histidine kinase [Ancylomarina sp. DW003]|nr:HAMP domain-containing sensor histidine kinase [Ancylomarina sp. DW003]MDE5421295.1 HAMP domain-containing histidine kinase [Ancylomarina sp. DW003]
MKNRFQIILSSSVFIILFIGFVSYSFWVEQIIFNNLKKQALDDNLTIGESVLNMLDKSNISPENKLEFIKLVQETTDVLKMPNKGFICMADSMGTLLAAPGLKPDNKVSINSAQFLTIEREKSTKYSDFFKTNPFVGYYEYPNHKYSDIIVALNHPYAGFKILVHQDANTIKKLAKAKSRPFLWTGLLFAFFIATISYFIISRQIRVYQNKIENQQQKLEASNEEIMAQNDELENQNTLLKELAEEKSILLGIMAHDLRNPLGGIESVVNLIDKIGDLTEDQEAYFSLLKPQVESAQQLISDVLEMNQLENKTQDIDTIEIDIDKFINDKISQFKTIADEKSIKLKTVNNETTLSCFTSHNELNRISDNLLSNAIKYTPIGKSITIETQIANNKLNINFIDEGAGIPQEELSLLFKKFSKLSTRPTNEEPSTGLGLYIVRLLSEKIGAVTSVKSEVGIGSTFTLSLPLK